MKTILKVCCVGVLFLRAGAVPAQMPRPPQWVPFELEAISLYETGINEESSDPQAALKTLQQAQQISTAAIAHGGGGSAVVLHNDTLIAHALAAAQADAAKAPENGGATQNPKNGGNIAQNGKSGGSKPAKPSGNHSQPASRLR